MRFCFDRSSVVTRVRISDDERYYEFFAVAWGSVFVPVERLQIRVLAKLDNRTGRPLLDLIEEKSGFAECAILAASTRHVLEYFFKKHLVRFPSHRPDGNH